MTYAATIRRAHSHASNRLQFCARIDRHPGNLHAPGALAAHPDEGKLHGAKGTDAAEYQAKRHEQLELTTHQIIQGIRLEPLLQRIQVGRHVVRRRPRAARAAAQEQRPRPGQCRQVLHRQGLQGPPSAAAHMVQFMGQDHLREAYRQDRGQRMSWPLAMKPWALE